MQVPKFWRAKIGDKQIEFARLKTRISVLASGFAQQRPHSNVAQKWIGSEIVYMMN